MIIEFLGGYWFNSLALMADAGHMANDSLSLFLALLALFLSAHTHTSSVQAPRSQGPSVPHTEAPWSEGYVR